MHFYRRWCKQDRIDVLLRVKRWPKMKARVWLEEESLLKEAAIVEEGLARRPFRSKKEGEREWLRWGNPSICLTQVQEKVLDLVVGMPLVESAREEMS